MVSKNVTSTLATLAKKRSQVEKNACRALLTGVHVKQTASSQLMSATSKLFKTSRKFLWRHTKFRIQLDENDELACWANICRKPYEYILSYNVSDNVEEFWYWNFLVSPNEKNIMRHCISRGVY